MIDVEGQGGAENPFAIVSILPAEEIWNYEIGLKSQWLDNRLGFDLSYFFFGGNRFRLQPETTASLALVHELALAGGAGVQSMLSYTWRSKVYFENANTPIAGQDIAEDAVSLVGLNIGYTTADGDWRVGAYADNLLDKEYIIDAGNTGGAFGTPTFIAAPPRFYGVEVAYNF
ncbi:TonB-dependent receptor [Haliea sp. E1-2-M8]|uniref:TonB-dependent receptor n=1 Tax=Haliea sp. E1-2-M8 TaxID=3064706 RepID=UPI00271792BA|nr:TonB-dependent receptor [Haliea sp. E1-2-M8]MDO8863164.1 TonB-dependent receptor [Haliea sp. E1-2-M8]